MAQAVSISEEIFRRWCEKLHNEQTVPRTLVEAIEMLHEQRKLSDTEALGELLKQVRGTGDDKD